MWIVWRLRSRQGTPPRRPLKSYDLYSAFISPKTLHPFSLNGSCTATWSSGSSSCNFVFSSHPTPRGTYGKSFPCAQKCRFHRTKTTNACHRIFGADRGFVHPPETEWRCTRIPQALYIIFPLYSYYTSPIPFLNLFYGSLTLWSIVYSGFRKMTRQTADKSKIRVATGYCSSRVEMQWWFFAHCTFLYKFFRIDYFCCIYVPIWTIICFIEVYCWIGTLKYVTMLGAASNRIDFL